MEIYGPSYPVKNLQWLPSILQKPSKLLTTVKKQFCTLCSAFSMVLSLQPAAQPWMWQAHSSPWAPSNSLHCLQTSPTSNCPLLAKRFRPEVTLDGLRHQVPGSPRKSLISSRCGISGRCGISSRCGISGRCVMWHILPNVPLIRHEGLKGRRWCGSQTHPFSLLARAHLQPAE